MYSSKMTRLIAGTSLAILLTAALAGCSRDPDKRVSAGAATILDKIMPARYSNLVVDHDNCLLYLSPPSAMEELRNMFMWTVADPNALRGSATDFDDSWNLVAHRERTHWVVEDYSVDPSVTAPVEMASVIQGCMADAETSGQKAVNEAKKAAVQASQQAERARQTAASWLPPASGVLAVPVGEK
ncbi:hypothetical protein G3A43_08520 [Paraburkholderia aspalathi]|nr:hypothetical protein [Paraburkholderia aspalathi]MBK3780300.1 hypothetical protein [Paraburkholderia aspalathi]